MRLLRLERDWHGKRLHQVQVSRLSSSATFPCDIAPSKRQPLPRVHLECQVHRLRSRGGGADWSEPAIGHQSAFKEQRRLEKFELLPWSFNTVFFWVKWQHGHAADCRMQKKDVFSCTGKSASYHYAFIRDRLFCPDLGSPVYFYRGSELTNRNTPGRASFIFLYPL